MRVCVCCQIQLICQGSGLFLERPELASLNQAAINLPQPWLTGSRAVVLLEQVTLQSGGSFPDLHFSAERRKRMQSGDIYLFGYVFDLTIRVPSTALAASAGWRIRSARSCTLCTPFHRYPRSHLSLSLSVGEGFLYRSDSEQASMPTCTFMSGGALSGHCRFAILPCGKPQVFSAVLSVLSPDPSVLFLCTAWLQHCMVARD